MGDTQFKIGYWLVNNKARLVKLAKYLLFGLIALLGAVFLLYLLRYIADFRQAGQYMSQISGREVNYGGISQPSPLEIGNTFSFPVGADKKDLMGYVTNPNPDWSGKAFVYSFAGAGSPRESFILPGETKALTELGVPGGGPGGRPSLVVSDVRWLKAKAGLPELNFEFKDLEYRTAESASGGEAAGSIVSGTVVNKSAFGFYETKVTVVLAYGGNPVGVGVTRIDDFRSFEEKPVELRFPDRYPIGVDIEPEIEVNILDEDNLIYPGQ